jgi:hypothetical protein
LHCLIGQWRAQAEAPPEPPIAAVGGPHSGRKPASRPPAVEGTESSLWRGILALRKRQVKTAFSFCQNGANEISYLEVQVKMPFSF